MAIPSRQIGWSTQSNLLWQISKRLELLIKVMGANNTPTTTSTTTSISNNALKLTFDNITNVSALVGDVSSVSNWNTYFDLPTYGNAFTSVVVIGNEISLFGGSNIIIKEMLFDQEDELGAHLLEVDDQAGCIIEVQYDGFGYDNGRGCRNVSYMNLPQLVTAGDYAFSNLGFNAPALTLNLPQLQTTGEACFDVCRRLSTINLPLLSNVGANSFTSCESLTTISLPACTNLGGTVGDNGVFLSITGQTITLTVPSALITCNSGDPDGDIDILQTYNTVTVITV